MTWIYRSMSQDVTRLAQSNSVHNAQPYRNYIHSGTVSDYEYTTTYIGCLRIAESILCCLTAIATMVTIDY